MYRVVTIGGGTGSFVVNSGLLRHPEIHSTAICTTYDNGGSTGILRDQYGTLPAGDVRRCMLALSSLQGTLRELYAYRFEKGHSLGNLMMSAAESLWGRRESIARMSELLHVRGAVAPVSYDDAQLVATLSDGSRIVGESAIGTRDRNDPRSILSVDFEGSPPHISSDARDAILQADMIILCPGSLHTSLLPCLLTPGMHEAIMRSDAQIVWVPNLMNHPSETRNYTPAQFMSRVLAALPRARLNATVVNNGLIPDALCAQYRDAEGVTIVGTAEQYRLLAESAWSFTNAVVADDLIDRGGAAAGLIRHDGRTLSSIAHRLLERPVRKTFIVDIDDTIAWTTQDLRGDPARVEQLTPVAGAAEFLRKVRMYGHKLVILSAVQGEEWIQYQLRKLEIIGVADACRDVRVVLKPEDKKEIIELLAAPSGGVGAVVIGDAPMYELAYGVACGATVVRVALPIRRHWECTEVSGRSGLLEIDRLDDPRLLSLVTERCTAW